MKVILLEKVPSLGDLGTVANVRAGYARNYLFPQGKAERATPKIVAEFEKRRAELEERQNRRNEILQQAREALDGYLLQMPARASADGGLYGSITPAAVATALNGEKLTETDIKRGQISLPGGNLKEVGDHEVSVILQPGVEAKITVSVLSEDAGTQGSHARKGETS